MAEYDLGFAAKLAETADLLDERQPHNNDARRVMVYLSRLSMEISLKALLEQAGKPVQQIRSRSHELNDLLADLDECEVASSSNDASMIWTSANVVREQKIDLGMVKIPIGELVVATHPDLSKYPNQIRYGATVVDFHPVFLIASAKVLVSWAHNHWKTIRWRHGDC